MEWYLKVVRDNYSNFEGRARRQEYWMFTLFHVIILFILALIGGMVSGFSDSTFGFVPIGIYLLGTIIPSIAVTVRRLHDINKSGWFYLVGMIPYVGGFIMLFFTCKNGDVGSNQYGPDPKNPNSDDINEIGKPILD